MLTNFQSKKGFTLIELLIVVAIISILVSIGAVSFSRVQSQGRDTTRKADLQEVASALEQFYSDNNTYPQSNGSPDFRMLKCDNTTQIVWGEVSPNPFDCPADNITYLAEMPEDPQGNTQYRYQATTVGGAGCINTNPLTTCQRFTLSAKLERVDNPNLGCDGQGALPATGYDLCVNNP